jgi:hypothetical protein
MKKGERLPTDAIRRPCACRDCIVETIEGMCQRCRTFGCSAQGNLECLSPNAYALTAKFTNIAR